VIPHAEILALRDEWDQSEIILRIDGGRIRPSKSLADSLAALMKGNREFTMIDEQKLVYERALHLARTTPGQPSEPWRRMHPARRPGGRLLLLRGGHLEWRSRGLSG
jgi:hypothetical protein